MSWEDRHGLKLRLNKLPLILAGPILRDTLHFAVTVWVALKEQRTVSLGVYTNERGFPELLLSHSRQTVPLGKNLHVVAVTAIPVDGSRWLESGKIYHYNLDFGNGQTLDSIGDKSPTGGVHITYPNDPLPSFALPPNDLNKLRIFHGSCRKPHAPGSDMFAQLDRIIENAMNQDVSDAARRPHQLFLTGDQIYAEDVADPLLKMLTDAGDTLLGWTTPEMLPGIGTTPAALPPGHRAQIAKEKGGLESDKPSVTKSHLFGLGEFYAMYLFGWSEVLWPTTAPLDIPAFEDLYPEETKTGLLKNNPLYNTYLAEESAMSIFHDNLFGVRRALAHVPTYMILDDHEVTDDLYINFEWCKNILGTAATPGKPLGKRVLQNALLAYAVFQAWGNTPEQFISVSTPGGKLLEAAAAWKGDLVGDGANDAREQVIRDTLGIPTIDEPNRTLARPTDALVWHYKVQGENHTVLVLDTRTRRGFPGADNDSPALLYNQPDVPKDPRAPNNQSFDEQIDEMVPGDDADKLLIVVSPLPLIITPLAALGKTTDTVVEDDREDWGITPFQFEMLLARLFKRRKNIVVLSGDVHHAYTSRIGFWANHFFGEPSQSGNGVLVHLVASAMKNEDFYTRGLHAVGYVAGVDSLPDVIRNVGWNSPPAPDKVGVNPTASDRAYWVQYRPWRFRQSPAVLALSDASVMLRICVPEDWQYRIDFLLAENDEEDKANRNVNPAPVRNPKPDPLPTDWDRVYAMREYKNASGNAEKLLKKWANGKEIVGLNNIGEVTFQWTPLPKAVIHQLWWIPGVSFAPSKWIVSMEENDPKYPKVNDIRRNCP